MNPLRVLVDVRCLCGKVHAFLRDRVVDGLGTARWKCGSCKRRFVIACTPALDGLEESYWPLFLEQVPSTGSTLQEGSSTDDRTGAATPPEIHFRCRCACRLVGRAAMFGRPTRCPKCGSRLVLRVGYESDAGKPVPLLEYPEGGTIGQSGVGAL